MDLLEATGSNLTNGIIAGTRRCLATSPAATSRDRSPPCLLQHLPTRQIIGEAVSSEANLAVLASNSARQRWRQACCQTDSTCAEVRTLPRAPPAHRKLSRPARSRINTRPHYLCRWMSCSQSISPALQKRSCDKTKDTARLVSYAQSASNSSHVGFCLFRFTMIG